MALESRLVAVLRIRTLIAELSELEFSAFMSRIWRVFGREQILSLLFNPLLKQQSSSGVNQNADVNIDNAPSNRLTEISRIASDIIRNRETKSNPRTKPNITNIPSPLIREIASFLELPEHVPIFWLFSDAACSLWQKLFISMSLCIYGPIETISTSNSKSY